MKKHQNQTPSDPNAWMVTFGDLLMLLLTFFVMILATKSIKTQSMQEMFKADSNNNKTPIGSGAGTDVDPMGDLLKPKMILGESDIKRNFDLINSGTNFTAKGINVREFTKAVEISEDDRGVVITLDADTLFSSGKARIQPAKRPILDQIGELLTTSKNDILIMGHTDSDPIRTGTYKTNLALSFQRALTVLAYFVQEKEVLFPQRVAAGGYGEYRNLYPNDSPENKAKNRRVEFILRKPN